MKNYYVYILASERNGTLYIGITSNLIKRIWEHKSKAISGFTSKYNVSKLVYFEEFQDINLAISKEKLLKSWQRKWKINLIEKTNHEWKDLYDEIVSGFQCQALE
ncbi:MULTISPECIES: GIY-YIG nuclease family protein [unclassified Wolbachia]|uniref:GIY-YIG nuclease family protein n=1 Tax=unclassified Wolbachia TaxID=2640676 RepID=UPI00222E6C8C|nr:GIY-YIG nuclease family protein [Wolbachia endosymbiont (group A) of Apoderus coryli]